MNIERWQDVVEQIKQNFEVEDTGTDEDIDEAGTTTEFIVFNGPLGRLRLEFTSRPLILETKTHYTKRIGSDVGVENIYSDTEQTHTLSVWKWDEAADDWREFDSKLFQ